MAPLRTSFLALLVALALTSCSDGSTTGGTDAGRAPADSGSDRTDAGTLDEDAGSDASIDAAADDADGDGHAAPLDCNDSDAGVHPGADELCNMIDDDCDEAVDEEATDVATFYRDLDGDGYGTAVDTHAACSAPSGYVATDGDCDDTDRGTSPSAIEICNVFDDDCDLRVDEEATDARTFYVDDDGDGFGTATSAIQSCDLVAPAGYSDLPNDCDDTSVGVNPISAERCSTVGVDDDCDGTADEGAATDAATWYRDVDVDRFGGLTTTTACTDPSTPTETWVAQGGDCNDGTMNVYPGAPDLPDDQLLDANCDGMDGDAAVSVFVAPSIANCGCSDAQGSGTRNQPFCTLSRAILAVARPSKNTVVLANGTYSETSTISLRGGVDLVGGYRCSETSGGVRQWIRIAPAMSTTTIVAQAGSADGVTMHARAVDAVTTLTRLDGLEIQGPDMRAVPGAESIALRVVGVVPELLELRNVSIVGGHGGHGVPGADGERRDCGTIAGGAGGFRTGGDCGANAGNVGAGSGEVGGSAGGGGGAMGASWCVQACGPPGWEGISDGIDGSAGESGRNGTRGVAGTNALGTFHPSTGAWTPSEGGHGGNGYHGGGGGGGGQGGSRGQCTCINCCQIHWGNFGGRGGQGGCGGGAGRGGTSGGPSIALQIVSTGAPATGGVTFKAAVSIRRGDGGNGGAGGAGANGDRSPAGEEGDGRSQWECSAGVFYGAGAGGDGGAGGSGGGGGGGAGGHGGASWGIVYIGNGASAVGSRSYVAGGVGGMGGVGGAGGRQGVGGAQAPGGQDGSAGPVANERM